MKRFGRIGTFSALAAVALILSAAAPAPRDKSPFARAVAAVSAKRLSARIAFLADDLLEGRGTGARGSEIAARYIATEFAGAGLKPAGDNGGYLQKFELVGVAPDASGGVQFAGPKGAIELKAAENSVMTTRSQQDRIDIDAPVVFAGFGITAPDQNWDDYAGVDVTDKVVLCLIGEPPSQDPALFGGAALTYYGRWTYKYEEAARHHARALFIIDVDKLAPYGWQVIRSSWSGEQSQLPLEKGEPALPVAGYITGALAQRVLAGEGQNLDALVKKAVQRGFRPVELKNTRLRGTARFTIRRYRTENVAGILEGSDPRRRDTFVALTAHFDHLGIGVPDSHGDRIYNGAVDNASGTSALLEIARAAADGAWRPKRSILFLALTAEEQGLLGSAYAAKHPPVPIERIAANFNMDETPVNGELQDYSLLGLDRTTLEPIAERVASEMNIRLDPDAHPEQGSYFRSDHFSLAQVGVPAISVDPGPLVRGHDAAYGQKLFDDYNVHHYHQPSDQYDPNWDLAGSVQECRFVMRLTEAVANEAAMPRFKKGSAIAGAMALAP